jgi:hypothetical protein
LQDSVIKAYKVILKASMGQRIMNKTWNLKLIAATAGLWIGQKYCIVVIIAENVKIVA